jgi:hypothetical protein
MSAFSGALQPTFAEAVAAAELIQERRKREAGLEISQSEAESLLALDRMQPESTSVWREFVSDAIADHLVASEPAGILTDEKIDWLLARVAPEGRVESPAAFETLVRTLEQASDACPKLSVFAIQQLQTAIINGEGAAIGSRKHFSRTVDTEDAGLLYRILVAASGKEGMPVAREEADALFELHDATARSQNDTTFNDLFYRAIANYTLAASGHALEPRKEALSPEYVLSSRNRPSVEQAAWLSERIMRDGKPTVPEFELLLLIGNEPLKTDTSLQMLIDSMY